VAAKTYLEWHKEQGWKNNNFYFVGMGCWQAATKAAEEKFTSTDTAIPKLPTYDEVVSSIELDQNDCFKLTKDHYSGMRRCYDFICRQLRAGA
jgi:hypothetical protein